MSLVAKKEFDSKEFKRLDQGVHQGVCNLIVDLGWQEDEYLGEKKTLPKCYVRWEVPSERVEWKDADGNDCEGPMTIGKEYTVGLGDRYTMRKDFEGWRGKAFSAEEEMGFQVESILGACCQLSVIHKTSKTGNTYAKVDTIVAWPKGLDKITAENDLLFYDSTTGNYDKLPKWLQKKVDEQVLEKPEPEEPPMEGDFDDDIPF